MGRLKKQGRKAEHAGALVPHGRASGALNGSFAEHLQRMTHYGSIANAPQSFLRSLLKVATQHFGEGHVWVKGIASAIKPGRGAPIVGPHINAIPAPRIAPINVVSASTLAGRDIPPFMGAGTSEPNSYTAPIMMRMDPKTGRSVDTAQVIQDAVRYMSNAPTVRSRPLWPYNAPVNRYSREQMLARSSVGWLPPFMISGDQPNQYVRNSRPIPLGPRPPMAGPSRPLRQPQMLDPIHRYHPHTEAPRRIPQLAGAQQYDLGQSAPGAQFAVPGRPIGIAPGAAPPAGGGAFPPPGQLAAISTAFGVPLPVPPPVPPRPAPAHPPPVPERPAAKRVRLLREEEARRFVAEAAAMAAGAPPVPPRPGRVSAPAVPARDNADYQFKRSMAAQANVYRTLKRERDAANARAAATGAPAVPSRIIRDVAAGRITNFDQAIAAADAAEADVPPPLPPRPKYTPRPRGSAAQPPVQSPPVPERPAAKRIRVAREVEDMQQRTDRLENALAELERQMEARNRSRAAQQHLDALLARVDANAAPSARASPPVPAAVSPPQAPPAAATPKARHRRRESLPVLQDVPASPFSPVIPRALFDSPAAPAASASLLATLEQARLAREEFDRQLARQVEVEKEQKRRESLRNLRRQRRAPVRYSPSQEVVQQTLSRLRPTSRRVAEGLPFT